MKKVLAIDSWHSYFCTGNHGLVEEGECSRHHSRWAKPYHSSDYCNCMAQNGRKEPHQAECKDRRIGTGRCAGGALLGVGMCLCMVFDKMISGQYWPGGNTALDADSDDKGNSRLNGLLQQFFVRRLPRGLCRKTELLRIFVQVLK